MPGRYLWAKGTIPNKTLTKNKALTYKARFLTWTKKANVYFFLKGPLQKGQLLKGPKPSNRPVWKFLKLVAKIFPSLSKNADL